MGAKSGFKVKAEEQTKVEQDIRVQRVEAEECISSHLQPSSAPMELP